ncbi:uncharacterized protein LOC108632507 [Ceratina calcarata]|uniref:Uncharacterized protein LOC108632507 n=1 Tax=Ceratina calcarata TaxID=156304 RepID=A0AAJ7JH22_9HYME|nr:uncharacterized protein LOC108632507 [Ceratina calcarata]
MDTAKVTPKAVQPPRNMVRVIPPKGKNQDSKATKLGSNPEIRSRLRRANSNANRVNIGWRSLRFEDFIQVPQCFKCQAFGHVAKYCRSDEVCGHCAEKGHTLVSCQSRDKPRVCSPCKKAGKEHKHVSRKEACATYKVALERLIARTDYG